jgi:phosphoglycerate dehydrogenase-like enzyme
MADISSVLATSVPDQERPFADEHLARARVTDEPLSRKLVEKHSDARVLSLMVHDPVTIEALEAFDDLEAIVTRSDGYDHLPLDWMRDNHVLGFHLGGYATVSVAHHALTMILSLLRRVPEGMAMTGGESPGWDRSALMGRHLEDVTVGVLGTGRIGSAVVRLLAGMGARTIGHDVEPDPTLEQLAGFEYAGGLDAMLAASDVVTVHVPLDEATEGMIGEEELERLPAGACLVNTARGGVLDQSAVEQALADGQLAGYAADVLPGEPQPPALDRFARFDNVVLTPHLAAYDERTTDARYERTREILDAVLEADVERMREYRVV